VSVADSFISMRSSAGVHPTAFERSRSKSSVSVSASPSSEIGLY